jgi:Flp pilus assembly protein TadB
MIVLVVAALAVVVGLLLIVRALGDVAEDTGRAAGPSRAEMFESYLHDRVVWRRAGIALGAGVIAGLFTGWPVAALLAAAGAWFLPALIGRDTGAREQIARIEAIATWAEMMRDTLAAAAGLEQTIRATATAAPGPIREEVAQLADAIRRGERLDTALSRFQHELADPNADVIVVSLIQASRHPAGNLAEMLGEMAKATRAQAGLHMRATADRARTRTTVRIIIAVVLTFAIGLTLFNRTYLSPYNTPVGQAVLLMVAGLFGAATLWLSRISRGKPPARFFTRVETQSEHEYGGMS